MTINPNSRVTEDEVVDVLAAAGQALGVGRIAVRVSHKRDDSGELPSTNQVNSALRAAVLAGRVVAVQGDDVARRLYGARRVDNRLTSRGWCYTTPEKANEFAALTSGDRVMRAQLELQAKKLREVLGNVTPGEVYVNGSRVVLSLDHVQVGELLHRLAEES